MMIHAIGARLRRNPYPVYTLLRQMRPVCRVPRLGHWVVTGHESVRRALTDPEVFSSDVSHAGFGTLGWFIFADAPRHTALRGLVSRAFTPRSVAQLEPRIHELAHALLDLHADHETLDLVSDLALPLPLMVIAELLGVPAAEWRTFRGWSDAILGLVSVVGGGPRATAAIAAYRLAHEEMQHYLGPLLASRRSPGDDDLLRRLVHAEVDGARLTVDEIVSFFELLLFAGHETTSNLIANAVLCLLEHPRQLDRVRAEPDLWPSAIEEVLRFRSPVQGVFRATRRDTTLGGRTIPAGRLVLVMIGAANRDPRQFERPNEFDVARSPNGHVTFGHGIHFCIGAALARLEARVVLPVLFDRLPALSLAERTPWEPRPSFHVHGPSRLPVRYRGAAAGVTRVAPPPIASTCPMHSPAT